MRPEDAATPLARLLEELLGPGHPKAATTLHDVAVVCAGQGEDAKAQSLWAAAQHVLTQGDQA